MTARPAGAVAVLLATILLAAAVGCAEPPPTGRVAGARSEERLERLRALPYVSWDPGADVDRRGVVHWDRARAWPGYNLYTNDADEVYLLDMAGRRVHTWTIPPTRHGHCEHAEMLAGGEILVVCVNDAVFRLDWRGRTVFEKALDAHHDVAPLPDGRLVVPIHEGLYAYRRRLVWFDGLVWLGADGRLLDAWSTFRRLEALRTRHPASSLDEPGRWLHLLRQSYDYHHLNAVEALPETSLGARDPRFSAGNLLLCFRNTDLLVILDRASREIVWSWGPGRLDGPHTPTLLPTGTIMVFDNGTRRGFSRVLELDPLSEEIVWEYRGDPLESFFSPWRGSSQRVANGNTLICESERGRAFEVTPDGEIVWEFWNPEVVDGRRKRIYRLIRMAPSAIEPHLRPQDRPAASARRARQSPSGPAAVE